MTDQNRNQQNQRGGQDKGGQGGNNRGQGNQGQGNQGRGGNDQGMQSQGRQDQDIEAAGDDDDIEMEGRGGRPGGARNRRVDNRGSDNTSGNR
jgi:hypothetical protein